jgi:hypothetical protein
LTVQEYINIIYTKLITVCKFHFQKKLDFCFLRYKYDSRC